METYSFEQPLSQGSHHPEWFQSVASEFLDELENERQRGKNLSVAQNCLKLLERSKESHQQGVSVPF